MVLKFVKIREFYTFFFNSVKFGRLCDDCRFVNSDITKTESELHVASSSFVCHGSPLPVILSIPSSNFVFFSLLVPHLIACDCGFGKYMTSLYSN